MTQVDRRAAAAEKRRARRKRMQRRLYMYVAVTLAIALLSFYVGYRVGGQSRRGRQNILLVNEANPLPADYVPDELVNLYTMRHSFRLANTGIELTRVAYEAAQEMFAAAEAEDVNGFIITSGYRSYARQEEIYKESKQGYAQKPGASEHQTGLCFDVTAQNDGSGFETTSQYAWLRKNAHKYGFIQRYPGNKADITGINYEPWHYRYVGIEAATEIYRAGITLEEYLD